MLHAHRHDVDAGRIDAAVAQNVRQLRDILLHSVERTGKQLAQVVRKDLAGLHPRLFAERLHLRPDIASIEQLSAPGDENRAGADAAFLCVGQKKAAQLSGDQNGPGLALAPDGNLSALNILHGEKAQLSHADAGSAEGFEDQPEPGSFSRGVEQAQILRLCELLLFRAVGRLLELQALHPAVPPVHEIQKAVHAGQHGIDGAHRIALFQQLLLVGHHYLLSDRLILHKYRKSADVPQILFHGRPALFFQYEGLLEGVEFLLCQHSFFHFA